ncbi:hypothetical protein COO91_11194 (plasmid) [Nostoc flagelliforme CCNUN1]|uniref:Uncharacterized protein n=1 Tax=Nostoc flagelliforme CCNUN1 TaxID=2038116 RepID=A0A2K8TBB6_9NOSO|nr:hypothetical protein COO91_11194 [Nostoc flagelliforme CCNUN1]
MQGNITPSKAQVSPPGFFGLSAIASLSFPLRNFLVVIYTSYFFL